jgi:signal transduction histidine kinase
LTLETALHNDKDPFSGAASMRSRKGIRTYALLLLGMALVTVIVTSLCALIIRQRWRGQITDDLSRDLEHSVISFQDLQDERLAALERENALLAENSTLKALMTSGDDLTIQDGAVEFWDLSGTDLFALANSSGRVVATYSKTPSQNSRLRDALSAILSSHGTHYLIDGQSLYACSLRPFYLGTDESGTLLGYVIIGVSIERTVRQISQPTGVEATFLSGGKVVASTLAPSVQSGLAANPPLLSGTAKAPTAVQLGDTQFLAAAEDLSSSASSPLQLVVLKSLEPAKRSIDEMDRMVLSAGLLALVCGTILMITLSRLVTRPLEELSKGVRAFGMGDITYKIPRHGTREMMELSDAFARMRSEIQQANLALIESERLATIGRMASSVSHDFRHYLATIYANSEFLASEQFSARERAEIFADIRNAVLGTTDMIESLLIFSRTGSSVRRSPELMATLLERAATLARTHPDSDKIRIENRYGDAGDTLVVVDGNQIERAIFNLLINACQAVQPLGTAGHVLATIEVREHEVVVNVIDDGPGVPDSIRDNLFEPFVSEGKQKGTGLGLTLARSIATEHGGEVTLLSSRPGETIFQMKVARDIHTHDDVPALESPIQAGEPDEKL